MSQRCHFVSDKTLSCQEPWAFALLATRVVRTCRRSAPSAVRRASRQLALARAREAMAAVVPAVKGPYKPYQNPARTPVHGFGVELWSEGVKLRPCEEEVDSNSPPIFHEYVFVVDPGCTQELHYKHYKAAARRGDDVLYGGRVYVDKGDGKLDAAGAKLDPRDGREPDHLFVFGKGSDTFVDKGFYVGNGVSLRYTAAPAAPQFSEDGGDAPLPPFEKRLEDAQKLGKICVSFAAVLSITTVKKRKREHQEAAPVFEQRLPVAVSVAEQMKLSDYCCSTVPGEPVREKHMRDVEVKLTEPAFEHRIHYKHAAAFLKAINNPRAFAMLPLSLFSPDVRLRLIQITLADLQQTLFNVQVAALAAVNGRMSSVSSNPPIAVSDVVHHLSRCVSPAASYFACVGDFKAGRYARSASTLGERMRCAGTYACCARLRLHCVQARRERGAARAHG